MDGSQKDANVCVLFEKTGCCPKREMCDKVHNVSPLARCVIFHHIFPNPDVFIASLPPRTLEIDDDEKQRLIDAFFLDIAIMCKRFGPVDDIVICANTVDHLCGNVLVWFREADAAIMCQTALNEQFYAGRKIIVSLCSSPRFSQSVCKGFLEGKCPLGLLCHFIHPLEPSYQIFNECIPRSVKVYPEKFRRHKVCRILDTPDEIIAGRCKATIKSSALLPQGFPTKNIYV
jgi:splicing factor U2AF subunit